MHSLLSFTRWAEAGAPALAWSDDDQWLAGNDSEGGYAINLESGELLPVDRGEEIIAVDFLPRWHELLVESDSTSSTSTWGLAFSSSRMCNFFPFLLTKLMTM